MKGRFKHGGIGGVNLRTGADWTQNTEACFIAGLLILGLGMMPLASGLYGYYVTLPEIERSQETVNEAAEELGLEGIPGISVDDNLARLFTIMILAGVSLMVIGAALLLIALSGKKRCVEKRP
jgi:hypothetical protein